MKHLLMILVLGLLWCNVGFADELFGIKLGDDIKNYSKDGIYIKPKKPNPDFENYIAVTTKRNKIHKIQASLKRKFDTKKSCAERLQYYTGVVHERLSKTKKPILRTKEHKIYLDNNNYWYNNKFFKIGDATQYIQWDNINLNISASNVSVTGNISGSAISTGSFGTVQATHFTGDGAGLTNVPDYVFESDYDLKPLSYVETFVSQSLHLPNVPGRDDFEGWKSYDVGGRDMLLLEKIEELTLYTIQLEKRLKALEDK